MRSAAIIGSALLVLSACGGEDVPDGVDEVDDAAASPSAVPSDGTESDAATDDADEEAPDEADTGETVEADVTEEDGMATLRPPSDAQPECDGIDEQAPGASLTFPTDDAGMLDLGPGPVTVEFVGCSNTFEANLVYDAFHGEDRTPTVTGNTMGGSMGTWDAFAFEETFWTPGEWTVVVYEDDAASGERQEYDQVRFSIE